MKFASTLLRFFLQKTSLDFYDLLDFKNLALFFRISDVRVISLTVRSRDHLESNVSKFETDKFLSPMGRLCRYFLSLFLL